MLDPKIYGLRLETDPIINHMFPDRLQDMQSRNIDVPDTSETLISRFVKYNTDIRSASGKKCSWSKRRIERFIYRYVSIYKKRNYPHKDFFLKQLRSVAEENHVRLPSDEAIRSAKDKSKKAELVCELVDLNTENRVSEYKYYFDGSHVVAYIPGENKASEREVRERTKWDDLFDTVYPVIKSELEPKNMTKEKKQLIRDKIEAELIRQFYELYDYDDTASSETCLEFIARKLYNKSAAYSMRKKRFYRKKDQIRWTAWWTITFDDSKFTDEHEFRRKLLNYFRNQAVRRHWLVMGVFEHGEDNGRLHFHGFFYIPDGMQVGKLVEAEHYSSKRRCTEKYIENTELREKFGINQYEDISEAMSKDVNAMADYTSKMLRYMDKGETVFYSRHIPMEFTGNFGTHDMIMFYNITCKRPIKRYIVASQVITRTDISIYRTEEIKCFDEKDPFDNGLLDVA